MLVQTLPAPGSQAYGTGAASAEVVYNVMDFLAGITAPLAPNANRLGTDFAVSELQVIGQKHTAPTTVQAAVRSNTLTGAVVTVILLVNGTPALYGGNVVSETLYINPASSTFATLVWQAAGGGPYSLSVEVLAAADQDSLNNIFSGSILPIPLTFS